MKQLIKRLEKYFSVPVKIEPIGNIGLDIYGIKVGVVKIKSGYIYKLYGKWIKDEQELVNYFWDNIFPNNFKGEAILERNLTSKASELLQKLDESSITRLFFTHAREHDCAVITAFRAGPGCGDTGEVYSKKDKLKRNKSLLAKLMAKGYGVTRILGKYPEGGETKKETAFFVVDLQQFCSFAHR